LLDLERKLSFEVGKAAIKTVEERPALVPLRPLSDLCIPLYSSIVANPPPCRSCFPPSFPHRNLDLSLVQGGRPEVDRRDAQGDHSEHEEQEGNT